MYTFCALTGQNEKINKTHTRENLSPLKKMYLKIVVSVNESTRTMILFRPICAACDVYHSFMLKVEHNS